MKESLKKGFIINNKNKQKRCNMRFLASDLDGTLVDFNEIIQENLDGIKKLKESGNKFIISTGRSRNGVKKLLEKYNLDYDYMLLGNGALVLDKDGNKIVDEWIPSNILKKVVESFYNNSNTLIYVDSKDGNMLIDNPKVDKSGIERMLAYFDKIITLDEFKNFNEDVRILSIFSVNKDESLVIDIQENINKQFENKVNVFRNNIFLDIVPAGCSKGNGLLKVLELENEDVSSLYTIGDSHNDISMFKITENSYTFNRVDNDIKEHTNNLVDYVYEVVDETIGS